jgi:hypothetical protein
MSGIGQVLSGVGQALSVSRRYRLPGFRSQMFSGIGQRCDAEEFGVHSPSCFQSIATTPLRQTPDKPERTNLTPRAGSAPEARSAAASGRHATPGRSAWQAGEAILRANRGGALACEADGRRPVLCRNGNAATFSAVKRLRTARLKQCREAKSFTGVVSANEPRKENPCAKLNAFPKTLSCLNNFC